MLYLLLSMLLFALNNVFWKWKLGSAHPGVLVWSRSVYSSLFALAGLWWVPQPWSTLQQALSSDGPSYLLSSFLGALGLFSMIKGLQKNTLNTFAVFQVLITVFSGILMAQYFSLTSQSIVGTLLILGAYAYYIYHSESREPGGVQQWWWFVLMATGFTGAGFINWMLVKSHPPILNVVVQEVGIFAFLLPWMVVKHRGELREPVRSAPTLAVFAALIFGATFFGAHGLKITDPLLASAVGLAVPILTATFGVLFLGESFQSKWWISFGLLAAGLLVLSSNIG